MIIEGSGTWSVPVSLTNGSECVSGRSKNIRILWIRIRIWNRICNTGFFIVHTWKGFISALGSTLSLGSHQCCGSGSVGFVCFWASQIRIRIRQSQVRIRLWILLSSSKNIKKNLDFYCFVTSFWLFYQCSGSASGSVPKCHKSTTLVFNAYF